MPFITNHSKRFVASCDFAIPPGATLEILEKRWKDAKKTSVIKALLTQNVLQEVKRPSPQSLRKNVTTPDVPSKEEPAKPDKSGKGL